MLLTASVGRRCARLLTAFLAVAGATIALPAAAGAATTVANSGGSLTITGDALANDITIAPAGAGSVTVTDAGAGTTVTGSGGCTVVGNTATCPSPFSLSAAGNDNNDTITIQTGISSFINTLDGGAGNDTLNGGENRETMTGGAGDDTLNGNAGFDQLDGGTGSDTLNGGADGDTVSYASRTAAVNVSLDGARNDGEAGENDLVASDVESVLGGSGNDTITGSATADDPNAPAGRFLSGGAGNDVINGGVNDEALSGDAGDDTLNGGAGDDDVDGGAGTDTIDGGDGNDTLGASTNGDDDVHGGAGFDTTTYAESGPGPAFAQIDQSVSLDDQANDGSPGEKDNVHSDVENVTTAGGNDNVVGSDSANQITTGSGNDRIDGKGGPDFLSAGAGGDTVLARNGVADLVDCGTGTDTATTDNVDKVGGCENNDSAAVPTPQGQTVAAPKDTTAAAVTLSGLTSKIRRRDFLRKGVSFTLKPSEAVTFDSDLLGKTRSARIARAGDLVLASKAGALAANATQKVTLKLSSKLKRALPSKSFRIRLRVLAIDAGGNRTTVTRTIRVK